MSGRADAVEELSVSEQIIQDLINEMNELKNDVLQFTEKYQNCINEISELALLSQVLPETYQKRVLTSEQIYDKIILDEKKQEKPGWEERVQLLKEFISGCNGGDMQSFSSKPLQDLQDHLRRKYENMKKYT